jgi:hypothetical protein
LTFQVPGLQGTVLGLATHDQVEAHDQLKVRKVHQERPLEMNPQVRDLRGTVLVLVTHDQVEAQDQLKVRKVHQERTLVIQKTQHQVKAAGLERPTLLS